MTALFTALLISYLATAQSATTAIEQAQMFALKKNRKAACSALMKAWEATPATAKPARQKLNESLQQISQMFFTDKGQKLFESGQSMLFDNPDLALNQLREALILEDGNIQILSRQAIAQMLKQDCEGAQKSIGQARALNPLSGEAAALEMRVLVCLQKFSDFRSKANSFFVLDKWQQSFVHYLSAQDYLQQQSPKRAMELLTKVLDEQPEFPEVYWHLSRAGRELGRDTTEWLQRYVSLCKAVTTKERRHFELEPKLCHSLKEAEYEISKKSTEI
jgi:hypothetical protein